MSFLNLKTVFFHQNRFVILSPDGEISESVTPPFELSLCFNKKKMNYPNGLDVLELFAFLYPTTRVAPSLRAVAEYFRLSVPDDVEGKAFTVYQIAEALFQKLDEFSASEKGEIAFLASQMTKWNWSVILKEALPDVPDLFKLFAVLKLYETEAVPPADDASFLPVSETEIKRELKAVLEKLNKKEIRQDQQNYALSVGHIFKIPSEDNPVPTVLAQAGTGIGKTLGYGVPAFVWSRKNSGRLVVSTYTKTLQNQVFEELSRLFNPDEIMIQKGQENYLCLLNYSEHLERSGFSTAAGFLTRWMNKTRDGDLKSGDFPGWAIDLIGPLSFLNFTEKRGECLYKACPFFSRCFIEKRRNRAEKARIIISNHALVMTELAREDLTVSHFIFDEAHHLFNAADSTFSAEISGYAGFAMRQFLFGTPRSSSRLKGFRRRVEEMTTNLSDETIDLMEEMLLSANFLPTEGFLKRILSHEPQGVYEEFLCAVLERVKLVNQDSEYSSEAPAYPATDDVLAFSRPLKEAFICFSENIKRFLNSFLSEETSSFEKSVIFRLLEPSLAFIGMLQSLEDGESAEYTDWFELTKFDGNAFDVSFSRHYIDPMVPLYQLINRKVNGLLLTSATLKTSYDESWQTTLQETGARYLPKEAECLSFKSPFNYREQSQVLLVNNVDKKSAADVSEAFYRLFKASKGGGLGIFTAIRRLKSVYRMIEPLLAKEGIDVLAQHCSDMSSSTLVELFRAEKETCLLGTDTMRDGIDVPGEALHLVVFDRLPWPRPDILHKSRRALYPSGVYDKMKTAFKLSQGFGRLIRSQQDKGVFVILESRIPSAVLTAFPPEVEIKRVNLDQAIEIISEKFKNTECNIS